MLAGDCHAAGGDGFWSAAELSNDVAIVAVQQVDAGAWAGKEHVDVGADPVLRAGCEDPAAADVRGNDPAEHHGRHRVNDAAFRAHRLAAGSESLRFSMGALGAEEASRRR